MANLEHLCDPKIFEVVSSARLKKLTGCRRRQADPFTCGGCHSTFPTICTLHIHCQKHNEGGSYYFDSLTRTAYPKYDTACVYTQVTADLLQQASLDDQETDAKTNCADDPIQVDTPAVRVSKQIGKRNGNKRGAKAELRESEQIDTGDQLTDSIEDLMHTNMTELVEHDHVVKADGTELTELERSNDESQKDDKSNDSELIVAHSQDSPQGETQQRQYFTKKKRKIKHIDSETMTDLYFNDNETEYTCTMVHSKKHARKSIKKVPRNNTKSNNSSTMKETSGNNDILTSDSHKKDELTASEVLLAISKGGTADVSNDILDKDTDTDQDNPNDSSKQSGEMSIKIERTVKLAENSRTSSKKQVISHVRADGQREYECNVCGKIGSNAMLSYHRYLHMEKKSFECDVCGLMFQIPRSLAIHKLQHEEKQYKCLSCPASFHRKQYLVTHQLKHSGEAPFMCDTCGKSYRDKMHLRRHMKHVHENQRDFTCDVCSERFFRSDHLKNHRLRHFIADKRCRFCSRMFKHPEDLVRHTRTHTGEKSWYCHLCGHGFVASTPYYTHMKKKHSINKEEAKVLKNRSREELKQKLQVRNKDPADEPQPVPIPAKSKKTNHSQTTLDEESTKYASQMIQLDPGLDPIERSSETTNDASTYVDLPNCDSSPIVKEDPEPTEHRFAENSLMIKFRDSSNNVRTYEGVLGQDQVASVADLLTVGSSQGSEINAVSGEPVTMETIADISEREGIQLGGDNNEFNVIIAVDNLEFGTDTVMFIDGEQCQSEVVIDN